MRIIDVHCHPGTQRWHITMGPYIDALRKYWGQDWPVKTEEEMVDDFKRNKVEPVIVALDVEHEINTVPTDNEYVSILRDKYDCIAQAWGTVTRTAAGRRLNRRNTPSRHSSCWASTFTPSPAVTP